MKLAEIKLGDWVVAGDGRGGQVIAIRQDQPPNSAAYVTICLGDPNAFWNNGAAPQITLPLWAVELDPMGQQAAA